MALTPTTGNDGIPLLGKRIAPFMSREGKSLPPGFSLGFPLTSCSHQGSILIRGGLVELCGPSLELLTSPFGSRLRTS
jgi:hypothetical protein